VTGALPARRGSRGVTLIELVCVTAVILVLAGMAIPVAKTMVKRHKELELRQALRQMRTAIDRFQADVERYPGMRAKLNTTNEEGFPEKLDHLYKGFDIGDAKGTKLKYLRRIPIDPITGKREWQTRSSRDEPGSHFTDGINVFDVRSTSGATALDGTKYADW
jgi:general secretion pathway protein G